jgi:hypothetical protein
VVRTPHRGLTWLRAPGSRQAAAITAILSFFTGFLISDGYSAYQQLLPQLAGVQQCCSTSSAATARSPSSAPAAC